MPDFESGGGSPNLPGSISFVGMAEDYFGEKTMELNTITVKKGVKDGKNYLLFALNGQQVEKTNEVLWTISRNLTGTHRESSTGIFSHSSQEFISYGEQRTSFPDELRLSDDLTTIEYAKRLKARILFARKWVGEQDYDQEESFRV